MSSILSGFEYDIFISYRQNDNRSGWVTEFVNHLNEELAATIKEPVSVYFDSNPNDGLLDQHLKMICLDYITKFLIREVLNQGLVIFSDHAPFVCR